MSLVAGSGATIEQVSVDEAYLDFSASCQAGTPDESLRRALPVARAIKDEIRAQRQLTASIGLASNKLLAKLASDHEKPDGLTLIEETRKIEFLRPLPVRVLHGVGEVTAHELQQVGIVTVGDLQVYQGDLRPVVGSFATTLKRYALGEDDRPLDLSTEAKSISSENTFLHDTDDRQVLRATFGNKPKKSAPSSRRKVWLPKPWRSAFATATLPP